MVEIDGYLLKQTCGACPEQYDVFKDDDKVGYLRLRHNVFTVSIPDCSGENIYCACPKGDGMFAEDERSFYLNRAIKEIYNHRNDKREPLVNV